MLYIALIIIILCIILFDLYFKKRKKDIAKMSVKKSFTDNFERNILLVLIFSAGTFFYLANNYNSIKEYAVKFTFSKNIENASPETLREIYDDAISKNSSLIIEKLIEENPDNSELHALAAHYFFNADMPNDGYVTDEEAVEFYQKINKKTIYHATQAINMDSYYEPWLLGYRGWSKYFLEDKSAKLDFKNSLSLFEVLLESSPNDANILYQLGQVKSFENRIFPSSVYACYAEEPRFLIPMQYFKKALNNSSKDDPFINMLGWETESNLHKSIYESLEWNARINIGSESNDTNYNGFRASEKHCGTSWETEKYLHRLMSSNGFCEIFSKAGEQGYEEAYDVIQKWCN